MRKLNILHITSNDRWTGSAEPVVNLVLSLKARGHNVYMAYTRGRSMETHLKETDIEFVENVSLKRSGNPFHSISDIKTLCKFVSEKEIDIIHSHISHDQWIGGMVKKFAKKELIHFRTRHKIPEIETDPLHGYLHKKLTDCHIALCHAVKNKYIKEANLDPEKVEVVLGAVNTKKYNPQVNGTEVKEALGFAPNDKVVGMISHFKPDRGYDHLFNVMPAIKEKVPNAKFILAGGRSRYQRDLQQRINDIGLKDDVRIIIDHSYKWEELLSVMNLSCYMALGSEGTGRAMLEVMAIGRPIIAADIGAVRDTIEDGVSGKIIGQHDEDALKKAILEILTDDDKAKSMCVRSRQIIEEKFTLAAQTSKMEELYYKHLNN